MIIRTHHNKDNPYVVVNVTIFNDPRLSWKETGLGGYLLTKPDHWEANVRHLAKQKTDGMSSVSSGLKRLEELYYLSRVREQNETTGQFEWSVDFYESYELNPAWLALSEEDRKAVLNPCADNPYMGFPDTGKPDMGEPGMGNPPKVIKEQVSIESVSSSGGGGGGERADAAEGNPVAVFWDFWKQNMPGSLTELIVDDLNDLINTYGIAEVQYAAEQAVRMNKRFIKYVSGVCRNRAAGIEPGGKDEKHRNSNRTNNRGKPEAPAKPGQERFAGLLAE